MTDGLRGADQDLGRRFDANGIHGSVKSIVPSGLFLGCDHGGPFACFAMGLSDQLESGAMRLVEHNVSV